MIWVDVNSLAWLMSLQLLLISSNKSPAYNLANIFGSLMFFFEEFTLSFPSITFLGHKTHTMAPSADGAPPISIAKSHELPSTRPIATKLKEITADKASNEWV